MSKQSTIIHHDMLAIVHEMPDEMAGRFVKILHAAMISDIPLPEDFSLKMAIMPFISQIKRDQDKYQLVCDRNKSNGSKGGRPPTPKNPTKPIGLSGNPNNPTKPDNDNGSDNKNDNDNGKVKQKDLGGKPPASFPLKKRFIIPTVEEVEVYCQERGNGISGQQFVDANQAKGWVVGKSPMKDWRAAVRTWEGYRKNKITPALDRVDRRVAELMGES